MYHRLTALAASLVLSTCAHTPASDPTSLPKDSLANTQQKAAHVSKYPTSKQGEVVDDLNGLKIADPYRWLEDADSADTAAWVSAQNQLTFGWLNKIPARDLLKARLTELWDYERYGTPFVEGTGAQRRTYFWKNDGLQNQAVLFHVEEGPCRKDSP